MNSSVEIAEEMSFRKPAGIGLAYAVGFFFSFRLFINLISVRVLGVDPRGGAELDLALNFSLLVLVCFHSLGEVRQSFASMLRLASVRWVAGFLVFSCLSLTWSSTALMPAAIAYWCALAADVMMVALLLRAAPVEVAAGSLMKGFVWGACAIAAIAWLMPAQADLRLGDEEFFNSNQIGFICAFAFFLAQYLMRRKEGKWGVAALFLAVTLLRSLSKTTIVAFVLSEVYLLMRDRSMSRKTKGYIAAGVAIIILLFWGLLASYYNVYTNTDNQAETLTGRTAIWAYVLNASLEQPWIGHGFNSMWKVIPPFGTDQFEARHAENELLQQFYSYGLVGICLLAGLYGSLYRQFRRLSNGPLRILLVSMLLFIVIRGFAEAEPFDLLLPLWVIVLFSLLANEMSRSNVEGLTGEDMGLEPIQAGES
jgi:exopolysaccharide production protein ExoQ